MLSVFAFCVQRQQDQVLLGGTYEVDHPDATGLATTRPTPAHLANAARARDNNSGVRMFRDECRERTPLLLGPVKRPLLLEQEGLDDREHLETIRLRRIAVQSSFAIASNEISRPETSTRLSPHLQSLVHCREARPLSPFQAALRQWPQQSGKPFA